MRQPVIFIGMHRSGTSMLGRLLEQLDLFVGTAKDENNEAIFFQEINTWLLSQSGGRWDMPAPIDHLWQNEEVLAAVERYIRNLIDSPRSIGFLGTRRYIAGGMAALNSPWGWKDPRNTFTLPMWLRIFPEARVVCIERHGVDVAQSLRVREVRELESAKRHYDRYRSIFFLRPKGGGFVGSPRCTSLEGGFSLWREYTGQARAAAARLPGDRVLTLRYEDLLGNPVEHLRSAAEFCGLHAPESRLREVAAGVRAERGLSYLSERELQQFALRHQAELRERGYPDRPDHRDLPVRAAGPAKPRSLAGQGGSARALA